MNIIISFYIVIFNRLPSYKKSVKSIQSIIKREGQAFEIAITPSFEENKITEKVIF